MQEVADWRLAGGETLDIFLPEIRDSKQNFRYKSSTIFCQAICCGKRIAKLTSEYDAYLYRVPNRPFAQRDKFGDGRNNDFSFLIGWITTKPMTCQMYYHKFITICKIYVQKLKFLYILKTIFRETSGVRRNFERGANVSKNFEK